MTIHIKRRWAALFAGVAIGAGMLTAQAEPVPATSTLLLVLKGQNPSESLITAKEALAYAQTKTRPNNGTLYINRIIDLVARAQTIPLGRTLTKKAAEHGVVYGVGNLGGGCGQYINPLKLIIFSFKGEKFDYTSDAAYQKNINDLQDTLYHELAHFFQGHIWKTFNAPGGLRTFDRGLWKLGTEAQAKLVAHTAMLQHRFGPFTPTQKTLMQNFTGYMTEADLGHIEDYNVIDARLDNGKTMQAQAFVDAFCRCPVTGKDFARGALKTPHDIYKIFVLPHPVLSDSYQRALEKMRDGKGVIRPSFR